MTVEISERSFEATIECELLMFGPDACPGDVNLAKQEPPVSVNSIWPTLMV